MTSGPVPSRFRLLVLCQVALIVVSLVAPLSGWAADPTTEPSTAPIASESSSEPTAEPTPEPTAEPTPEPTAEPTPEPTPEPTAEPTPEPEPTAKASAEPSAEPAATSEATPSADPVAPVDTDDYVVTFVQGASTSTRSSVLAAAGADVIDSIAPLRMAVIRVPDGSSTVADLRADARVSRVELDRVRATEVEPNDRGYADQWSLPRIGWDDVYGAVDPAGSAVVAVLDTGVDAGHRDLAGQLVAGTSLLAGTSATTDPNGHGTAMAGIIAAATDNRRGIAGVGFDGVRVMPVTVLDEDGLGQDSDIIEGIVWAVDHGADVINLSFSNPGFSAALQAAIDYAWDHDVVVVAATGNDGSSAPTYPAGDRGVIGVSNTDRRDRLNASSNHGPATFLAAPGTDIATLRPGGGLTSVTGTSASSAEVAGAAALLRAIDPSASNGVIVGRLARSAANVGTRAETGNGRLDLRRAARDRGTDSVRPVGAAPTGTGGPFVGPYVAASANVNATTTLNGSTGTINVAPGSSITLVMSVTTTAGGTNNDWNSSRWAFATSAPAAGSMTCVDHADHDGAATYTETFAITAPATAGNYNLYLYAYNGNACASGQGALFTRTLALDNLAPSATIDLQATSDTGASNTDDITNAASPVFAVAFGESVTGLAAGDFSVLGTATGCTVGAPAGGPAAYTVTLTGCSNGTVTLRLAAGAVTDGGANTNVQTVGPTVTIDRTAPTLTVDLQAASDTGTSSSDDITNAATLVFNVTFSESVTGLAAGDFSEQGSATGCVIPAPVGSGATYTETLTGCSAGTVILRVANNAVADTAGNTSALTNGPTITVDRTAPTATIDLQAASDSGSSSTDNITNAASLVYDVTFSESVTGLAATDFSNVGTATGCTVGAPSGSGAAYTVTLTGCSAGTVILRLAAGGVTDTAGNTNALTNGPTVTVDRTAPGVTVDLRAASDSGVSNSDNITNAASLTFDLTFTETVTGVAVVDFSTTGSTSTGCVIGAPSGSGAAYATTLTTCSNGNVVLSFAANGATDTAGNTGPTTVASLNVTVDRTAPAVTINQAVGQVDPTNASPINFTVVFSEAVSGFITGDVTVGGSSGGTKTGTVSGGPTTYAVAVTGMTTSGTVVASIAASRATDIAGNNNTASTATDNTVTWDVVAPAVTINQAVGQVDPDNTSPIVFTVVFSEAVTGFATGDVTVGGTSGGSKTGTVTGGPTTYTVTVTGMTTPGTVVASIGAGVATDSAGNANAASTSTDNTVNWDNVVPTITVFDLQSASDSGVSNTDNITNAPNLVFDVAFSESVTGLAANDFSNIGTATGCAFGAPVGSGTTYTVTVTGCSNGTVIARVRTAAVTDSAGNPNAQTDGPTVTVDRTAPSVTIDQALAQVDPTNVSPIAFTVVFSEPVVGFATGDVTVGGTSGGTKTGTVSGGPSTYSVAVTGMTTSGTVVASVAAARATDIAGNNNTASTSTDNTVTWNRATHVAFVQQPTDTVYGSTIAPAVTVAILDASDQVVTESSASVTLTLAPSGPTLGGTVTVAAVNGVATFNDLTVSAVGTYTLGATSAGLTGATSVAFDITPAPLTITADDRTKTYGQTVVFAGTEFTTSGLLNADTVTSVTLTSPGAVATATVAGSPYPITPSAAVGSGLANYTISYVPGALTVDRADPTIVVTGYSVTYDASPHTATGTATGAFGEDLSADLDLSATTHTAVGSYTDPWTFTDSTGNYNDDAGTVDNEITPAPLTVTADDRTKTYGQTVVFAGTEFTTSGLLGSDDVSSVTLTSPGAAATATVAGSPYPITPSAAVGSGLANYTITYVAGELTVTPAPLTITADDRTKTYGQTVVFAGTEFTTSGLLNADTVTSVTLTSPGAVATATVAGSPYPITPSAAVGSGLANYTISYVPGALTVDRADPTIVVTGYSVTYDASPHTATGTATGAFGEDLSADLDLSATTHTAVGSYTDPWTFTDSTGNYNDDAGTVDNEITPAPLTVTADDRTKTYGQTVVFAGTEFTTSGLLGSDDVSSVTLTSPGAAATATVAGSPYPITPSAAVGSGLANYTITYVAGELTVTPAPLTITADDQSKPFGVTFTFSGTEFSTSGLVNADTVDSATLSSAGAPAAAAPGSYPISISGAVGSGLANYAITYVGGTLTVGNTTPVVGDADVMTTATTTVAGAVAVTDPDTGQTVTLSITSGPAHGSATVAADGSFTYTPTGSYTGNDTFTIEGCDDDPTPACDTGTVTVAVYPVAVDDEATVSTDGGTVEVDVQANDIGDAGPLTIVSGPSHGTARVGSIIYTPDADYSGTDQVVYRVCSPNDATLCDDGVLSITVTGTGDTPETDTASLIATPLGPVPAAVVPTAIVILLALVAACGGAVAVKTRRRPTD